MKGKIMIMALLCALLVGLVPPSSAQAEDNEYFFGEWCLDNGYNCQVASDEDWSDVTSHFVYNENYEYILSASGGEVYLCVVHSSSSALGFCFTDKEHTNIGVQSLANSKNVTWKNFKYSQDGWHFLNGANPYISSSNLYSSFLSVPSSDSILFTSVDIFASNSFSGEPVVAKSESVMYSFVKWCDDVKLNCKASSNSSALDGPFEYDSTYSYFVAGNDENYNLIQVYSNAEIEQFTGFASYDNKIYLYLKDDITGTSIFVKRFFYDVDGWSTREIDYYTLQYGELLDLGVAVSADNMLYYSNRTVKTGELYGNVYYEKNTEFTEGFAGEVSPDHNPMITPTPSPSVPSPDIGYDVYIYKPSLNGKVNADSVNMRELPSVDSVAVASFIKTWSLSVQGYCYDNDGVIWYLCTTERDGVTYTGYMQAKYIKVETYGGIDVNFEGIDIEDVPAILDASKESLLSALDLVSVVPLMMGAVFGFLPSWCLLMVGASFVLICIVGIIKVFRG